mmetsp:Transcript_13442/g.43074  ORF Transcript_13442/g.43074 Transcript_13442/m.43074 type:complete len:269 (-) Transcript_13442:814-1620(-)
MEWRRPQVGCRRARRSVGARARDAPARGVRARDVRARDARARDARAGDARRRRRAGRSVAGRRTRAEEVGTCWGRGYCPARLQACTCAAAARGVRDGRGVAGGQANRAAVGGGGAGAGQRARMRSRGRRGMLAAAMDARLGPGGAAPSPRHSPTGPRQGAWGEGQAGAGAGGGRAPNAPAPPPPVQPRAAALAAPRRRWALGPGRRRGDATCCSYRTPTADWSMCVCRTGGGSQRCNHMGWGGAGVRRGRRGGRGLAGYCGADRLPVR